jgi:hypothetical protein
VENASAPGGFWGGFRMPMNFDRKVKNSIK